MSLLHEKRDIVNVISQGYLNIDAVYRKAFWIIFGVLCFSFGFHAIQFMWGNHDWDFVLRPQPWGTFLGSGRYALPSFRNLFLNGIYLPLIYDVLSFFFLSLNAVLLCIYWRLKKRVIYFVLCGLILTVQPFTLGLMYYVHMIPESFVGVTFIITALIISEKIAFNPDSLVRKLIYSALAIIMLNLSLAMYPVLLNTIAVAFIGRLLVQSFEWDGSWKQCRIHFVPYVVSVINIALGVLLYETLIAYVFSSDDFYNMNILPLERFPERLTFLLKQSFYQLYEYDFLFNSQAVLWVFLGFTIFVALYVCSTGNLKQKIVRLVLLGGSLFATQTAMMLANMHIIAARVELFGLVVFETLMAILVFTELKRLHNLSVLATTGVVWVSIVNDLDCLRAWKLGFDAEKMLWNRVLTRMEVQKDFDVGKKYKVIQIGMPITLRPHFLGKAWPTKKVHDKETMLMYSYTGPWSPLQSGEFYYQTYFRGERVRSDKGLMLSQYKSELKRLWEAGILEKAKAWPHENGLIVWKDVILFVTDAKLLDEYKQQLSKEFPKWPTVTDPALHVGNDRRYLDGIAPIQNSPLHNKKILFLGSSVTQGEASLGVSFADMLRRKYGFKMIKDAVGGTCLAGADGKGYISRLKKYTKDSKIDLLVVQLSTNDAQTNVPVQTKEEDIHSIEGAITYIAEYGHNILECPVIFFTSPSFGNEKYKKMCDCLRSIADTNEIHVVDIFRDGRFEMLSPSEFRLCMFDPVHPTLAGYLRWLPLFEVKILNLFPKKME